MDQIFFDSFYCKGEKSILFGIISILTKQPGMLADLKEKILKMCVKMC